MAQAWAAKPHSTASISRCQARCAPHSSSHTEAATTLVTPNKAAYSQAGTVAPSSLPQAICQGVRADRRCQSQVCWRTSSLRLRAASTLAYPVVLAHRPKTAVRPRLARRSWASDKTKGSARIRLHSSSVHSARLGRQLSQSWR